MIARRNQNRRHLDRRRTASPQNHAHCLDYLLACADTFDVHASIYPPLVHGPCTVPPLTCPHGVKFWVEPTGEQISRWVEVGTP